LNKTDVVPYYKELIKPIMNLNFKACL